MTNADDLREAIRLITNLGLKVESVNSHTGLITVSIPQPRS